MAPVAQVAEHARPQIVFVARQPFLGLARLGIGDRLGRETDGTVWAGRLAEPAGDALVAALGVVGHRQLAAEPVVHLQRSPVLGILLRDFRGEELRQRDLHAGHQGSHTVKQSFDIAHNQKCSLKTTTMTISSRLASPMGTRYFHSRVRIWSIRRRGNVHLIHISSHTTKKALAKNQTKPGI